MLLFRFPVSSATVKDFVPAIESSHAIAAVKRKLSKDDIIIINALVEI